MGGLDKAISDRGIVPPNGYMDKLHSDYNALISRNETVYKDCKTDEGNFPAEYFIIGLVNVYGVRRPAPDRGETRREPYGGDPAGFGG